MRKFFDTILRAFATGCMIGVGGTVYLSCSNKIMGAFLFGMGLFVILNFGFALFTGKVGYIVENKIDYTGYVCQVWLGNLLGTMLVAYLILATRVGAGVSEKAAALCTIKNGDSLISILILAFFCGILMFIAADGYKNITNPVGQCLAIFLPVMVFILSGFEHVIANMFYYTVARAWSWRSIGYLMVMTLGNTLGGIFIPMIRKGFIKQ